jgi:hypothetical protein
MMGRSHALSGWCAGLAAAPLLDLGTLAQAVPFAAAEDLEPDWFAAREA